MYDIMLLLSGEFVVMRFFEVLQIFVAVVVVVYELLSIYLHICVMKAFSMMSFEYFKINAMCLRRVVVL